MADAYALNRKRSICLFYRKNEVKHLNESRMSFNKLSNKLLKCFTKKEYKKWEEKNGKVDCKGGSWRSKNTTTTPKEWLSIYKYSEEYSVGWYSNPRDASQFEGMTNVMDFGAGVGTPWKNIPANTNLYLYEANLVACKNLKENYKNNSNVKVISSFKNLKNVKFDAIHSYDVLEHVRYLNEHLELFYLLGNNGCLYHFIIDIGAAGGHVYDLHDDTHLSPDWSQFNRN